MSDALTIPEPVASVHWRNLKAPMGPNSWI